MFERLGRFIVRNSRLTLTLFLLGTIAAGAIGFQAFGRLDSGGYSDKGSESYKATDYIINKFKVQEPVVTLVVDSTSSVDDPVVSAKGIALEREVRAIKGVTKP